MFRLKRGDFLILSPISFPYSERFFKEQKGKQVSVIYPIPRGFLTFSRGIEMEHMLEIGMEI